MSRLSKDMVPSTQTDTLSDIMHWMTRQDGVLAGAPGCQEGTSTSTKVRMNSAIDVIIGGRKYRLPAAEATLAGAGQDVTAAKFGAWRIELAANGTLTTTAATATGAMAFDSLEDALLNLASQARTANTIDVGYLVIQAAAGGFTIGTDDPKTADAQVTAATYYDVTCRKGDVGLNAALGAATTTPDAVTTFTLGTVNVDVNGVKKAQIAAQATAAFDDPDTVAEDKWGGWLVVSDPAGTGTYVLAADGVAGSASAMSYATQAAVDTALDNVQDRLPLLCAPICRLYFQNTGDGSTPGTWTAGTDDWDDAVIVAANAGSHHDYGIVHNKSAAKNYSAVRPTDDFETLVAAINTIINNAG